MPLIQIPEIRYAQVCANPLAGILLILTLRPGFTKREPQQVTEV